MCQYHYIYGSMSCDKDCLWIYEQAQCNALRTTINELWEWVLGSTNMPLFCNMNIKHFQKTNTLKTHHATAVY
jgi:hypothetical protein